MATRLASTIRCSGCDYVADPGDPFPFRCRKPRVQVVYIDLDHLHLYSGKSPDAIRSTTRDITNN